MIDRGFHRLLHLFIIEVFSIIFLSSHFSNIIPIYLTGGGGGYQKV